MNRTALKRILEQGAAPHPSALATPPQPLGAVDDRVVTPMLKMPLDQFERDGCPLEVRVPWFSETLWFVPGQADVAGLIQRGVGRGRIWTANELMDLLHLESLSREQVQTIAWAKLLFEGEVSHDGE